MPDGGTTERPKRIQLRKGYRLPENAIYVGRATIWDNPYRSSSPAEDVYLYRRLITQGAYRRQFLWLLRGHDLACWCPLVDKDGKPVPCHADVLLELANGHGVSRRSRVSIDRN